MKQWRAEGKRGIWLKIPTSRAALIAPAVEQGFGFHHAEPSYLMLTNWLPVGEKSPLPPNASHQVGVGAFVLNESGKLLLVQEAVGPLKGKGLWKIPTGLVEAGEDLPEAAIRELREETGIEAEFQSVVAFRHAHGFMSGKSDLFFVCILRAMSSQITIQPSEIAAAKWGDVDELLEQKPYPKDMPVWDRMYSLARDATQGQVETFRVERLAIGSRPGENNLYHAGGAGRAPAGGEDPLRHWVARFA